MLFRQARAEMHRNTGPMHLLGRARRPGRIWSTIRTARGQSDRGGPAFGSTDP
jgi:hypothetical protein